MKFLPTRHSTLRCQFFAASGRRRLRRRRHRRHSVPCVFCFLDDESRLLWAEKLGNKLFAAAAACGEVRENFSTGIGARLRQQKKHRARTPRRRRRRRECRRAPSFATRYRERRHTHRRGGETRERAIDLLPTRRSAAVPVCGRRRPHRVFPRPGAFVRGRRVPHRRRRLAHRDRQLTMRT